MPCSPHQGEPESALGSLATEIAREYGRDTATAAFEYTVPVFELAQCPALPRQIAIVNLFRYPV
jgi:hypothetical protein